MHYKFPVINHIDDVLPFIEGKSEFIVADKGTYKVVNYVVQKHDTFPDVIDRETAILRELRGITFHADGKIATRKFHKFFNVNEREETQIHNIDFSAPHVILEKLDGSMITPFINLDNFLMNGEVEWHTKMGRTDISAFVEEFVAKNERYRDFAVAMVMSNLTPIFEFCSRKNRVVIDYPEDRLVLLAARENTTGKYKAYKSLKMYADVFGLDLVKQYPGTAESMETFVEDIRSQEEGEGYVLRFENGHMIKIKSETYVRIHRTKDLISSERDVVELIMNEQLDDALGFMSDEDRGRISEYSNKFWDVVEKRVSELEDITRALLIHYETKKDFALNYQGDPYIRSIVFAIWDGKATVRRLVLETISKSLTTITKFEENKKLFFGDHEIWG